MFVRFFASLLLPAHLAVASYVTADIFSTNADCLSNSGLVQATIYREVGVCHNIPPGIPSSFPYSSKKSYRIDSCANNSPNLAVSATGMLT